MANPQREDGHIDIANNIADALARTQLSGHEMRILWALMRKTWGWVDKDKNGRIKRDQAGQILKKKTAVILAKEWQKLTGLDKYRVSRTLRSLILRQIVTKIGNKDGWGVQKDYDKWLPPIKEIVTKNGNLYFVTKNGNAFTKIGNAFTKIGNKEWSEVASKKKQRTPKETIEKETIEKEIITEQRELLNFFKQIPNYPFHLNTDIEFLRTLWVDFPEIKIPEELKKWSVWLMDNRKKLKKKVNYRLRFRNWLKIAQGGGYGKTYRDNNRKYGKEGQKFKGVFEEI